VWTDVVSTSLETPCVLMSRIGICCCMQEDSGTTTFPGPIADYSRLLNWVTDKCIPLVREITFLNAEVRWFFRVFSVDGLFCCLTMLLHMNHTIASSFSCFRLSIMSWLFLKLFASGECMSWILANAFWLLCKIITNGLSQLLFFTVDLRNKDYLL